MLSDKRLLQLVDLIYEAGTDPSRWPDALGGIAEAVSARSTVIASGEFKTGELRFLQTYRFDPDYVRPLIEHYFPLNPFLPAHLEHARDDSVYRAQRLVSDADLRRTEYYNDWLRPQEMDQMGGVWLWREDSVITWLDCQRPEKLGPYTDAEMETLDRIRPHLLRAMRITQRLGLMETQRAATLAALEHLAHGVVLLAEDGRIVHANAPATRLLAGPDGVTDAGGRLGATDVREHAELQRIVADAVQTALGRSVAGAGVMTLVASTAGRRVQVLVTPVSVMRGLSGLAPQRVSALAVIAEPEAPAALSNDLLRLLYGLTPAEARLAAALADGEDLAEIAECFSITRNTARSQLKAVLDKTGTHRQAELVRLLLRGPAGFSGNGVSGD